MSGIFLSYRRDDASGWAGRLYEHLAREWGADQVFIDIDTIAPGEDFREAITRTMRTCDVVLVVIGPNWLNARDEEGNRRLDDEGDIHRAEIVAALEARRHVVPVLVGGATMPRAAELPPPLKDLVYRNAAVIEDRRFAGDFSALQSTLRRLMGHAARSATSGGSGDVSGRDAQRAINKGTGPLPVLPTSLAVAGAAFVLIWGLFVVRGWHNELWGIRLAAGAVLVAGVATGLWSRRWTWVLASSIGGLGGLVLWMLALLSTHSAEVGEIVSPGADGFANGMTFAGAVLALVGGVIGTRPAARHTRQNLPAP